MISFAVIGSSLASRVSIGVKLESRKEGCCGFLAPSYRAANPPSAAATIFIMSAPTRGY